MQKKTINKYLKHFNKILKDGITISKYCDDNLIKVTTFYNFINKVKKDKNISDEDKNEILNVWNSIKNVQKSTEDKVETDDAAETSYIRDEDGKINFYQYRIFRKDKAPLCGRLTREEMNTIHRLYSYYGDSLTQRVISRHFVDLSLIDFKRILRVFNITKASAPFAPHMFEEKTEAELREIQLREKENGFLRKAEEDNIKNNEKLLKKYAQENLELRNIIKRNSEFNIIIPEDLKPTIVPEYEPVNQNLNLYLSDIHLGACLESGALYQENNNYGFNEAKRRLSEVLKGLRNFDCFDTINVVLLGDNIDCPGFFGKTARLDHDMPENMDPREQANKFIELIMWFISSLADKERALCSKIRVYSVPCGNHKI